MSNARELAELGGSYGSGGFVGMKNRIINGAMMIDQRNAGASVSNPNGYTVDRFTFDKVGSYGPTSCTVQQSAVAPTNFSKSLLLTVTTGASSPTASQAFRLVQSIEGYNTADLMFGTASAQSVTLSFWVRSSVTGTYAVALRNTAGNRSYVTSYSVNSANTWEQKTITIPGCTDGTWDTTNGSGIDVIWDLGVGSNYQTSANTWATGNFYGLSGSVKIATQTGATFYITGVQLEKGSTATSFDYRPYGTELQLCQRYYWNMSSAGAPYMPFGGVGNAVSGNAAYIPFSSPTPMRTAPSVSASTGSALILSNDGIGLVAVATTGVAIVYVGHPTNYQLAFSTAAAALTANRPYSLFAYNNTTMSVTFSAEL